MTQYYRRPASFHVIWPTGPPYVGPRLKTLVVNHDEQYSLRARNRQRLNWARVHTPALASVRPAALHVIRTISEATMYSRIAFHPCKGVRLNA